VRKVCCSQSGRACGAELAAAVAPELNSAMGSGSAIWAAWCRWVALELSKVRTRDRMAPGSPKRPATTSRREQGSGVQVMGALGETSSQSPSRAVYAEESRRTMSQPAGEVLAPRLAELDRDDGACQVLKAYVRHFSETPEVRQKLAAYSE
jgi:hypothetical protein